MNILNVVYTLRSFSSSKCSLFHNSNIFGSCIIHILYTGCAKIKKIYNSNLFGSCIIHILYIYSTNIGTEYFKHGTYYPFFLFKMKFV